MPWLFGEVSVDSESLPESDDVVLAIDERKREFLDILEVVVVVPKRLKVVLGIVENGSYAFPYVDLALDSQIGKHGFAKALEAERLVTTRVGALRRAGLENGFHALRAHWVVALWIDLEGHGRVEIPIPLAYRANVIGDSILIAIERARDGRGAGAFARHDCGFLSSAARILGYLTSSGR